MADRKELEQLFITLLLEDKGLETQYRAVVARAKEVAKEIQTAIAGSLGAGLVDDTALDAAFKNMEAKAQAATQVVEQAADAQDREAQTTKAAAETISKAVEATTKATADAAKAATSAMDGLAGAAQESAGAAENLADATKDTAESGKSFADWADKMRQRLQNLRSEVQREKEALDGLGDVQLKLGDTGETLSLTQKELDEVIKTLTANVASSRNLWAARVTSDVEFQESTRGLRSELLGLVEAGVLTDQQMRKVTQAAAYAQRGLDSAAGVASRGGLAWTMQIALTDRLTSGLRRMGPAGEVAGQALGIVSKEMQALLQVDPTRVLTSIVGGLVRLAAAATATAAAVVAGVTVALFKMGQAAAESAEKLTTAATRASLTVETFQEYAFAAQQSGVQVELLTTTLQRLQRRAVDAQKGNAGLRESFDRLGVTLTDAQGKMLKTEELFAQVADGLVGIEGDAERVALAFKIFDTEGAKLLPMLQRGSAGIQEMRDRARELGLVVSNDAVMSLVEFRNKAGEAQKQLETAKIEIVAGFMPVFTNLLIPLLQNTVVPWLQTLASRVNDFSEALRDAGPAGVEFRNGIAQALAPVISIVGYAQAAGASLDILNAKLQLSSAQTRLWLKQVDDAAGGLGPIINRALGFGPDYTAMTENVNALEAELARAEAVLADAIYKINNPGAITGAWLEGVVEQVNTTTRTLEGLGSAAQDAYEKAVNPPPPPPGSLAALRQQLQDAQRAFELAVTDEARFAAIERIRLKEAEIATITSMMNAADPFAAAAAWTKRLEAELRFGIKTAEEVLDLIFPRIEELREEASTALTSFGVDSQEYQETLGKLEVLERLLNSLGVQAEELDGVTMRGLQAELQALIAQGFEPTSEAVRDLLRQMNELELRGALEELRSKGVAGLSDWARSILQANGLLAEAVRLVPLTAPQAFATVLDQPLAKTRLLLHQFATGTSADLGLARTSWDDFTRNVAVGAASVESALNAPTEAFRIFQDTILGMMQAGADMQDVYDAIARSPFADAFNLMGFGEGPDPAEQLGLIQAAYAAQQEAYEALQTAMTEDAITAAGERYRAAQEEVRRLESLYADPISVEDLGASVREKLQNDLAAAGAAMHMFGRENELAARQMSLLESAITTLLQADPTAYVADLQVMWESIRGGAELAGDGVQDLTQVTAALAAAQERLAQLTGEAPSEFDNLRTAFQNAADAGLITNEVLAEMLELLGMLEEKAGAAAKLQGIADSLQIANQITGGLTGALEGLRDGNLDGVLSGLTNIGAAIGTAIGGPMVGAIVQQVGQVIQALPRLFQAISDLFTGDSPARRKLRDSLAQTVAGAFQRGIMDGLRGAEDWQANLRDGVQEAVLGALVDAFIQASVMQALFAPFIDQFTKILNQSGIAAAFAFFDENFDRVWDDAFAVIEGFIARAQRYFRQAEQVSGVDDPLRPGLFELPSATVSVLAAPQWALELTTAAERIGEAGDQMVIAAQMMQATFSQGIPVTQQSTRGVDAVRSL